MASNRQVPSKDVTVAGGAPSGAPVDDKWDEERIEASLRHLHELHLKLRSLRATIPRMLEPVVGTQTANPEDVFPAFEASVSVGRKDLQEFKDAWTNDATTKALERAVHSRQKNPLGIKPWRPKDDPNWTKTDAV